MSKRFGRNQRRRLQQKLTASLAAHALDRQLILAQRGTIDRLHQSLANVAKLLGKHYIGLEPQTMRMGQIPREVRLPITAIPPTTLCEHLDASLGQLRVVALHCAETAAWVERETERRHICVRTPDGQVAYAYQPGAFDGIPRDLAIRHLANQFAHQLASDLRVKEVL